MNLDQLKYKKNSSKQIVRLLTMSIAAIMILSGTSLFAWKAIYLGTSERLFIKIITAHLEMHDNQTVKLKDVTNFGWSKVCVSASDSLGHYFSNDGISQEHKGMIEGTRLALAFFHAEKMVKLYDFRIREKIIVDGKVYFWLGGFKGKNCIDQETAAMRPEVRGSRRELILVNLEQENNK